MDFDRITDVLDIDIAELRRKASLSESYYTVLVKESDALFALF